MVDRDFTLLTINKQLNMKYHTISAMATEGGTEGPQKDERAPSPLQELKG